MHKLLEYICDELEKLEKKADNDKLSMSEIQYGDTLAHFKKNLLTSEAMMDEYDDGSSHSARRYRPYSYDDGHSYRRMMTGRSRDSLNELSQGLRELERNAHDEESKKMIRRWMEQIEE